MSEQHLPGRTYRCDTARIRAHRARLCWTQTDLARHAGVGVRTISRIEGGHPVSDKVIHDVAAAFECSFEDLLERARARHNLPALVWGHRPRPVELAQIHRMLAPERPAQDESARACLLSGLGGIGKSQLALSYAWEHLEDYRSVIWLDAHTDLMLSAAVAAPLVDAPERSDPRQQVVAMQAALREGGPHLVVLDDVREPHAWRSWLLDRSEVRLLLTSRMQLRGVPTAAVGPLPVEHALELLHNGEGLTPERRHQRLELAEELGYLTLALAVARDVVDGGREIADLLADVRRDRIDWSDGVDPSDLSFDKNPSLSSLFQRSYAELLQDPTGRLAAAMLRVLGAAADAPLHVDRLFYAAMGRDENREQANAALERLFRASLAQRTREGITVHCLLRSWLQHHVSDDDRQAYHQSIIDHVSTTHAGTTDVLSLRPLRAHLDAVASQLTESSEPRAFLVPLRLAQLHWQLAMFDAAEANCRQALAVCPPGPHRTPLRLELAQQLVFLRRFDEALAWLQESLPLLETQHGPISDEMAQTYQVMGNAYFMQASQGDGEFIDAMPAFSRQLAILTALHGEDHVRTCVGYLTVGQVHLAMGDLPNALPYLERAAAVAEAAWGEHHLETCNARFLLGQVRHDLGDPDGMALMTEAHRAFLGIMGPHPQADLMQARLDERAADP